MERRMASLLLLGDFQMNVEKYIDSKTGKIAVLYSPGQDGTLGILLLFDREIVQALDLM
jgi:hypothetical protein